ncbi:hypothetical protein AX14_008773 [Amanita brunnescens Koide BX004]|nr:hypothetical protein AX14_008773 [Amanita brunnescens Koide BX004]
MPLYSRVRTTNEDNAEIPALEQGQGPQLPVSGHAPSLLEPSDDGSSSHNGSPTYRPGPRFSSSSRAPRQSIADPDRAAAAIDRASDRTDEIVCQEIQDGRRVAEGRSDAINVGKMMKILLPKYVGSESIGAFLRFLRDFLVYLVNYNLMGPNADLHRVSLLGASLKDRALKWYQHTIHLNADGSWTFELAMMELKRYFIKDVSSRDAASRFDSLLQGVKTVTELKKELERLSHQMVEPPSGYDMAQCFLNALKPEIAGAVVRRGINSENNNIEPSSKQPSQ